LICQKSWWDTVDFIAATLVGGLLHKFPELKPEMDKWNRDEDMWKVRTSMLFQLKYKDEVDFEALSRYILTHAESKEFFLRKASGWALRQYSKFNPDAVRHFIASHELSPLTVREGSKYC
jgi:3-methyladenine DNA glycosylase AlkD